MLLISLEIIKHHLAILNLLIYFALTKVYAILNLKCSINYEIYRKNLNISSRLAQWKRAGPITQRSVDRNYALLITF